MANPTQSLPLNSLCVTKYVCFECLYAFFDFPHMLLNLRELFITKYIPFIDKAANTEAVASFAIIRAMLDDHKNQKIKIKPCLTSSNFKTFRHDSLNLEQVLDVFSRITANAIRVANNDPNDNLCTK